MLKKIIFWLVQIFTNIWISIWPWPSKPRSKLRTFSESPYKKYIGSFNCCNSLRPSLHCQKWTCFSFWPWISWNRWIILLSNQLFTLLKKLFSIYDLHKLVCPKINNQIVNMKKRYFSDFLKMAQFYNFEHSNDLEKYSQGQI